jgi:hypothetical protein
VPSAPKAPARFAGTQWQHGLELASSGEQLNPSDQALALLHTARHDADTMTHALGLGRSQA